MISFAGNFLLLVGLVLAFIAMLLKGSRRITLFYLGASTPILAVLLLIFAFIISDFSIKNVFLNSSTILPITYKIAACWASHEGSMLLWLGLLCFISIIYIYFSGFSQEAKEFGILICRVLLLQSLYSLY